jgi:hypothetical protein
MRRPLVSQAMALPLQSVSKGAATAFADCRWKNFAMSESDSRAGKNPHASMASLMRFRVSGKSRSRLPVALAMALAIEAAAGP